MSACDPQQRVTHTTPYGGGLALLNNVSAALSVPQKAPHLLLPRLKRSRCACALFVLLTEVVVKGRGGGGGERLSGDPPPFHPQSYAHGGQQFLRQHSVAGNDMTASAVLWEAHSRACQTSLFFVVHLSPSFSTFSTPPPSLFVVKCLALNREFNPPPPTKNLLLYPPPRVQEPPCARTAPPGSAVEFSTSPFFARVMGFSWFWWMWDSYSGVQDNISCVLLRVPPSGGALSVSHSRTYPLNPSPLLSTPSPKQPAPDKETNKSQLNTVEH